MRWLLLCLLSMASAGQTAPSEEVDALRAIQALEQRIVTIGYRLAVARPDLCETATWRAGFTLHALPHYSGTYRHAAATAFGLQAEPAVFALVPTSAAAKAGLQVNDAVLALDGTKAPEGAAATPEALHAWMDEAFADGEAAVDIRRSDGAQRLRIAGTKGCATHFQLVASDAVLAKADGTYVHVASGLLRHVTDEEELAAVLAHEFAHNLLRHREVINGSAAAGGLLSIVSGRTRLTRQTEEEADRLSVYLLDAAGYDPRAAIRFWQRFGPARQPLLRSGSHPGWRKRVAALEEEIGRLPTQRDDPRPLPAFLRIRR